MWVKLCANTSAADARLCAAAGADAVGFVFAPSRRRVTPEAVAAMGLADLAIERVGVFVSAEAVEIVRSARVAGLTGVQLHGLPGGGSVRELAERVRAAAPELGVVPVVHWVVGEAGSGPRVAAELGELKAAGFGRVLLDAKVGEELGGTGVAFNWEAAAEAMQQVRGGMELVLAGGLRPETVAAAVRVLRPWGVDVASGVELKPGVKCAERVRAFVAAAKD